MSKGCCGYAPVVFKNNKWECAECGSVSQVNNVDGEQLEFDFNYLPGYNYKEDKKCECGSDSTFGKNSVTHSFWCPRYKK